MVNILQTFGTVGGAKVVVVVVVVVAGVVFNIFHKNVVVVEGVVGT